MRDVKAVGVGVGIADSALSLAEEAVDDFAVIQGEAFGVFSVFEVWVEDWLVVFDGTGDGDAEVVFDVLNATEEFGEVVEFVKGGAEGEGVFCCAHGGMCVVGMVG